MSICSAMSEINISMDGKEQSFEAMLDEVIRGIQGHLNQLQCYLRQIACADDRNEDYADVVKFSDEVSDNILDMSFLFDELQKITKDLVKPETPEEKEFLKKHLVERKFVLDKKKEDHKAKLKSLTVDKLESMQEE